VPGVSLSPNVERLSRPLVVGLFATPERIVQIRQNRLLGLKVERDDDQYIDRQAVAEEIADPLGPEFRRCADEMNFGLPFREAMLNLFRRFPIQDLQFLISAILLQRETGGNLAELLDKTAALLRSRIHLQQKVKVYTAQGRMTGGILLALPFIAFVLLNLVRPGYTAPLFESDTGRIMVYGTLVSMALGAYFIRRIIKIKY